MQVSGSIVQSPTAFWNNLAADLVGKKVWPLSAAESAAGLSTSDIYRNFPYGSLYRHKAAVDGSTDDTTPLVQALLACDVHPILPWFGTLEVDSSTEFDLPTSGVIQGGGNRISIIRRSSGTADIFEPTTDNLRFADFGMIGPNNTNVDGIIFNDNTGVRVERVRGYQLSTTVTAGLAATSSDVRCIGVESELNTQQGINFNYVNRGLIALCESINIGSTIQHHGFYIDRCLSVRVLGNLARGCYGAGIHVYVQQDSGAVAFAMRRIIVANNHCQANGVAASGVRGGIVVARADDGSSMKDISIHSNHLFNNAAYNLYVENCDEADIFDNNIDGNTKTVSGAFVGTSHSGITSRIRFRGNRCRQNTAGLRISAGTGTTLEMKVGANEFEENTDGIYADGAGTAQLELEKGQERGFRANSTDITGSFVTDTLAANISTMTGGENFRYRDGGYFEKDPGGSSRIFNPSGTFPAGHRVEVVNTANAAETITFDSGGIAQAITQNQRGIFRYNGTAWVKVFVG